MYVVGEGVDVESSIYIYKRNYKPINENTSLLLIYFISPIANASAMTVYDILRHLG